MATALALVWESQAPPFNATGEKNIQCFDFELDRKMKALAWRFGAAPQNDTPGLVAT